MRNKSLVCISSLYLIITLCSCCCSAFVVVVVRHHPVSFTTSSRRRRSAAAAVVLVASRAMLFLSSTTSSDDAVNDNEVHPMSSSSSRLSHMMLKVPSVDKTVEYWVNQWGGSIIRSRRKSKAKSSEDDEGSVLSSAFVGLGNYYDDSDVEEKTITSFSLELVETTNSTNFKLGNALEYIGVSMLMGIQKPPPQGNDNSNEEEEAEVKEPNGIHVKSVASAPGDYFARIVLKTKDLSATGQFYTQLLGMENAAMDESQICLRYSKHTTANGENSSGMPTTLVFEAFNDNNEEEEEEIVTGNCFDHLAIVTKANIDEQYDRLLQSLQDDPESSPSSSSRAKPPAAVVYMKPVDMFGSRIMGIKDPNGYKIVLASE